MNILITSHKFYPDIGGIESITVMLATYFAKKGHKVKVVTGTREDHIHKKFCFKVVRCPTSVELLKLFAWSDIILQNNIEVRRLWPLLIIRRPVVIGLQTWIGSNNSNKKLYRLLKIQALKYATEIIACSKAIGSEYSKKAIVIGNPYEHNLFEEKYKIQREKSIVFVGRLVSDKGADMLLQAFSTIHDQEWKLTIIGDGPEKIKLEYMAKQLNLTSRIKFTGYLRDQQLVSELNKHEIMVVPSRWREPFGIVALEGMACGCSMVVSDGGGLPDAVGNAGLTFENENQEDLNHKLKILVENKSIREKLRIRAKEQLLKHRADTIGEKYLSIILKAGGKRRVSRRKRAK